MVDCDIPMTFLFHPYYNKSLKTGIQIIWDLLGLSDLGIAEVGRVKFMANIFPLWTENEKPQPGQPDLPLHHHIPRLIFTCRLLLSESRAKTLACITRVRADIMHPNTKTCLFYGTVSLVARVAQLHSFLVFGRCCCHKSEPLDRGYTQSICLWHFADLPFDKTPPLGHTLGSKVMNSYKHKGSFPSAPLRVFRACKAIHHQTTKSENFNTILLILQTN